MQVWNVLHAAHWNSGCKNSPSAHDRTNLSHYIFTTEACIDNRKKDFLNSNIYSTCPHNTVNFGPLTAEISGQVWGTPANFNWFRVLALLLHWRHSSKLHDVWPFPGLVHCAYIFWGALFPLTEFLPGAKFTLHPSVAFSNIGSVTARHSSSGCSQTLWRGTRKGTTKLLLLVCATYILLGGHHVGHWATF